MASAAPSGLAWGALLVGGAIGALFSAVVTLFAASMFQPVVDQMVFGLLTFWRRDRGASLAPDGIWLSRYEYPDHAIPGHKLVDELFMVAIQRRARLMFSSLPRRGSSPVVVDLMTEGTILTGMWREQTPGGRLYQGAAQFASSPTGEMLTGAWIGYNKDGVVQVGEWVMTRVERNVKRATRRRYSNREDLEWSPHREG